MKRILAAAVACAVVFSAPFLRAEEEKDDAEKKSSGDVADALLAKQAEAEKAAAKNPFYQLVRLQHVDSGKVEVKRPREKEWILGEEGRYYPNGAEFRVSAKDPDDDREGAPRALFEFGPGCLLSVSNTCTFGTREVAIGSRTRTVLPKDGMLIFTLPRALPTNSVEVVAPHFALKDLAGESVVEYCAKDDGDECRINVVTGQMAVEGQHFRIAKMAAANQLLIRSESDGLFSSLRCEAGTYVVSLDQGTVVEKNFAEGTSREVEAKLDYELSPMCAVKIFRARSHAGGRVLADVMALAANGSMQNHRAFVEKRYNVNTGELVLKPAQAAAIKAAAEAALEKEKAEGEEGEEKKTDKKEEE